MVNGRWLLVTGFWHLVTGSEILGMNRGFGNLGTNNRKLAASYQCSGVSKQMTEDRNQRSDRVIHPLAFIICLLISFL